MRRARRRARLRSGSIERRHGVCFVNGSMRALQLSALLAALAACTGTEVEQATGDATEHVETDGLARHFAVAGSLVGAEAEAQRATGVVLVPIKDARGADTKAEDGTPIRATCGVTFVDRTHAITAAHCVPSSDLTPSDRVTVQLVDVPADGDWRATARVTGSFPAFRPHRVTSGYRTTDLACHVQVRCGTQFGPASCPVSANVDIALLACDDPLPAGREPVAIAESEPPQGAVQMFWFHEIYDVPRPTLLPLDGGADLVFSNATAEDLHWHYRELSEPAQNFHYFGGDRNQIFPLASAPWSAARPRRRGGPGPAYTVWTDLFGCHGASGSGVFQKSARTGKLELLGPAVLGGSWAHSSLCEDSAALAPGASSLAYLHSDVTRAIVAAAR